MAIIVESADSSVDYEFLKAEIADWMHRPDLLGKIPTFIQMIESKMSEDITAKAMQTVDTLVVDGISAYVNLPEDFKGMVRIGLPGKQPLRLATAEEIASEDSGHVGEPILYAIVGSQLQLLPAPDAAYTLGIVYERRIPALSDGSTTNWLLKRSLNAYLFGALMMASVYVKNEGDIGKYQALYQDAINGINNTDWNSSASLRVRAG